jgi:hypothetical protein
MTAREYFRLPESAGGFGLYLDSTLALRNQSVWSTFLVNRKGERGSKCA